MSLGAPLQRRESRMDDERIDIAYAMFAARAERLRALSPSV